MYAIVKEMPEDFKPSDIFRQNLDMSIRHLVEKYLRDDYDYDDYRAEHYWDNDEIDQIFDC